MDDFKISQLTRRDFTKATGLTIAGLAIQGCLSRKDYGPADLKRPNILLILADDMGFSDIGILGSEIQTPNIDSLAREGITFSNFHVAATCSPTRAMLHTGVDNHRIGMGNMIEIMADNQFNQPGYEGYLNDRAVTISTLLKNAGYHTCMAGKWHLGKNENSIPFARGFEKSFALMESGADNWEEKIYMPIYREVHFFQDDKPAHLPTKNYFSTDFYTDKVIEYIESNRLDNKPFFAYVSYQAVHKPHQAPQKYIDKYMNVYADGWDKIRRKRLKKLQQLGVMPPNTKMADNALTPTEYYKLPDWNTFSKARQKYMTKQMAVYAGMLDNMDMNIGKLIKYLKKIGQYDNTLILFLSDNGADPIDYTKTSRWAKWYQTNYNLEYKALGRKGAFCSYGSGWAGASNAPLSYYKFFSSEGGMRVPLIARFPAIKAGQITNAFGYVKDIAPTILEIAGVKNHNGMYKGKKVFPVTGKSLWPFMTGKTKSIHPEDETIGFELAGSIALFKGDMKLVKNPLPKVKNQWQLYNIKKDPAEMNNLTAEMPELLKKLKKEYYQYEKENGVIPVPEDYGPFKQAAKNAKRAINH
jgi:arylsulfatase